MMCNQCAIILTLHVKCEDGPNLTITTDHLEVTMDPDDVIDMQVFEDKVIHRRDPNFGKPVGQGITLGARYLLLRTDLLSRRTGY